MKNSIRTFLTVYLIINCCAVFAYGQNGEQHQKSDEPVLVPLTEEEKKINPKGIVENQPDFSAVQAYFSAREISGFSIASKVARKGNKYRTDTGFVVIITEPNKPAIRLNGNKTFEEEVGIRRPYVSPTSPLNPTDLLGFEDISLSSLGTIELDGSKLLKIQAKSKEFDEEVFLYADLGKKNLITIVQILSPRRSSIQRLQEISFEVPKEFFDISGYKELPKYKWKKIQNAKIYHEGKLFEEGVAYRYDKYIYIHAGEFSHLLVDVENKVAETVVFRGLLVSKDGSYIWETDEDEAISSGELNIEPNCKYCVKIKVGTNSLTIPNPDNKSKTLLKITW